MIKEGLPAKYGHGESGALTKKSGFFRIRISGSGSTWEIPLFKYPKNQFFIKASFSNSNICSYGALHRFSSRCFAETNRNRSYRCSQVLSLVICKYNELY